MKTPDLIHQLAKDLRPAPAWFWLKRFIIFLTGTFLVSALALWLLPFRFDLAWRMTDPLFRGETVLWLASTFLAAALVYESAVPGRWRAGKQMTALFVLGFLLFVLLYRLSASGVWTEFVYEFRWERGWCGPLMVAAGLLHGGLLFALARQGLPTRPRTTAFWAAISGGSLGAFLMQFVCWRENSLHVFVWHFSAIALLVAAAILVRRLLRD